MINEIVYRVVGLSDGTKLVPAHCELKVGKAIFTTFDCDVSSLKDQLRCTLAAMHLANAAGWAEFDVPGIVNELIQNHDRSYAKAVMRSFERQKPENEAKEIRALFGDPTPEEAAELREALRRTAKNFGHTCFEGEELRSEGRDDE